ncbi:MAG: hypothetical protein KatS3mg121_0273 [Gammaproteobacteria bacterium]|nr:MAG: hypothetical protein KatS3mg121_0273 [Gammaproteobacteria bacterium]
MKNLRRIKRMTRGEKRKKLMQLNLVSLMDVFTILVFFLLVNSASTEELTSPKNLTLPESIADRKPDQTTVVMVTPEAILLRGEPVARVADVLASEAQDIGSLKAALQEELERAIGLGGAEDRRRRVTIMADRELPFRLLKKVMSSCTAVGYNKISLAVIQKAQDDG